MKSIFAVKGDPVITELIRFPFTTFGYENKEARLDFILFDIRLPGFKELKTLKKTIEVPKVREKSAITPPAQPIKRDEDRLLKTENNEYISMTIDVSKFMMVLDSCTGGCRIS